MEPSRKSMLNWGECQDTKEWNTAVSILNPCDSWHSKTHSYQENPTGSKQGRTSHGPQWNWKVCMWSFLHKHTRYKQDWKRPIMPYLLGIQHIVAISLEAIIVLPNQPERLCANIQKIVSSEIKEIIGSQILGIVYTWYLWTQRDLDCKIGKFP